jgi:cysteinyl-tRNA synthetase
VRNYTDVGHMTSDDDAGEDKMEKASRREGVDPLLIAAKYIKIYEEDIADLNIKDPWKKPCATDHIKEMQKMVAVLLEKCFAYATPLAIYFDISKFPNYTALSGQNLEKNKIGEGSGEVSDPNKRNPRDFALWFFRAGVHKKASQFWRSPFKSPLVEHGEGFPGWHLECSAMSTKISGSTIDIHMGGLNIFRFTIPTKSPSMNRLMELSMLIIGFIMNISWLIMKRCPNPSARVFLWQKLKIKFLLRWFCVIIFFQLITVPSRILHGKLY